MADPVVLTVATDRNQYVKEFEQSLENNGYEYKLLGLGEEWTGFTMKMNLFRNVLPKLKNSIVIVSDSYDVLYLQTPEVIMEKYWELANGKIVIGLENIRTSFCNFSVICDPKIVDKCKIKNSKFPGFIYPNAGFIMGPASSILEIYNFQMEKGFKDDQYSLFKFIMDGNNCSKCYFDTGLDFVFNYFPKSLQSNANEDVVLKDGTLTIYNKKTKYSTQPSVVHIPGHYLDFGYRSESVRNFIFPYRKQKHKTEYMTEFYMKTCKPEFAYIGYWGWFVLFLFILIIVLIVMACVNK